jgi:plastocyanin
MRTSLIAVALLAVGCGSTSTDNDAGVVTDAGTVQTLNGCTAGNYVDRSSGSRTIAFGDSLGLVYSPKCMSINAGQTATFSGSFDTHPLAPGQYMGTGGSTPNPIPSTTSGSADVTVTFPTAGVYPYYCSAHGGSGMTGSILVK